MAAAAAAFELNWLHNKHHYTGETGATDSHCFCNGAQEVKYTIIDLGYEKNTQSRPPAGKQGARSEKKEKLIRPLLHIIKVMQRQFIWINFSLMSGQIYLTLMAIAPTSNKGPAAGSMCARVCMAAFLRNF
jgi:hypothetical protein